jgi:hypothetical protein
MEVPKKEIAKVEKKIANATEAMRKVFMRRTSEG